MDQQKMFFPKGNPTDAFDKDAHGRFQSELLIHTKDVCPICNSKVTKIRINGRGTYYCEKCQK